VAAKVNNSAIIGAVFIYRVRGAVNSLTMFFYAPLKARMPLQTSISRGSTRVTLPVRQIDDQKGDTYV
jgi:hypothetical protein